MKVLSAAKAWLLYECECEESDNKSLLPVPGTVADIYFADPC